MPTASHDDLLNARYGSQVKPDNIIWNAQVEQLIAHKSVRAFLPDPLPDGALETMVAAAQSASTSSNLNQWSVIAVSDATTRERLAYLAREQRPGQPEGAGVNEWIVQAPTVLLWVLDGSRNHETASAQGVPPEVFDYLDSFLMGAVDTALAAQNAVVAAESIGLGVTYLGSMRNRAEEVAELVGLPRHSIVVFGMVVGRPDPQRDTNVRPRPAQNVVLHRERYNERPDGWLAAYERAYLEFRTASGMRPKTWADAIGGSVSYEYMDGRQNLRRTLQERGFGLQ